MCTAICSWLRRQGIRVAPFKAQNMSNNSYPSLSGGEIGRAQVAQAMACGLEPEPAMNPILLKPNSAAHCQVVLNGKVWKTLPARSYYEHFDELLKVVLQSYEDLASRFDFVVIEGAGSVTELNLRPFDLVNFGLATRVSAPALLVSDIERGGVFASVLGTVVLLEPEEKKLLRSFAINKFRGNLSLFDDGRRILEQRSGLPCLGVFPHVADLHLDDEDSLSVPPAGLTEHSRYAILRFPTVSNTTDFRLIPNPVWIDQPIERPFEVVFLPGTKNTIHDLMWMRTQSLDEWVLDQARHGATIVGICGGFQMLGQLIRDPDAVESAVSESPGLGLLPMETTMQAEKTVRRVTGKTAEGILVSGYEIHMGQSRTFARDTTPLFELEDGSIEGIRAPGVIGTYVHGALESPEFLRHVLGIHPMPFQAGDTSYARLADWFDAHANGFAELYLS